MATTKTISRRGKTTRVMTNPAGASQMVTTRSSVSASDAATILNERNNKKASDIWKKSKAKGAW